MAAPLSATTRTAIGTTATRPAERYELVERLGAGGLGVVHRALDRATGRHVALKIMPRPQGGTNLRDEFVALARLRHPNIVAVLDYGLTDSGQEFFTMELVEGPPLLDAARPPESRPFFALLGGVLEALSAVHAQGMVHADLKPSNVLVDAVMLATDPSRAARLADFGLAGATGLARGTFLYSAPEAWAGRIDARSDLYSLGVVMYELITRRRPFEGVTPGEVLAEQRRSGPPDPRALVPSLDAGLAELIVALCDPAPGARPQTADEVRDRLHEIASTRGVVSRRLEGETRSTTRPIAVGGAIVGRERELEALDAAWADARAGRGRAIAMVGEEGIGKSRLLAEVAVRAQLDGGHAVRVSAAARPGAPWAGVDELVRALLAIAGDEWAEGDGAARGRALAPLVARGELADAGGFALAEAVSDLMLTAARRRPLAILVDDAHAAPPPAVQLLEYLLRAAPDAAVLLVIAVRPVELTRSKLGSAPAGISDQTGGSARLVAAARGARGGTRLDLPPLDRTSTFELAAAAVGTEIGYALGDALHRAAGGNPGHALRALELMAKEHRLSRSHGAWVASDLSDGMSADAIEVPLPENARAAAQSRLAGLPATSRAVLRAAAVIGDRFDRALLAAALGHPDEAVAAADADDSGSIHGLDSGDSSDGVPQPLPDARPRSEGVPSDLSRRIDETPPPREAIEAAVADGVAARVLTADPAAGTFQVAHPQLGALLADELAGASRALVIARTAGALERRSAHGRPVSAACLARLHLAGDDRRGAQRWARRAVDELAAAGDPRAAIELGRALLRLTAGRELAALAERIGDLAAGPGGEAGVALEHYTIADTQEGGSAGDRVRLALSISELHRRRGDLAIATALLDEALVVARAEDLASAQARCHLRLAAVLADRGATSRAEEHAGAGLVIARVAGDRAAAAELGQLAATLALTAGDRRRAIGLLEEALADATATAEPRLAAPVLHALGRAELLAGDHARAAVALERAIAEATTAGDVAQRARALGDLGRATYLGGDWGRARRAWERARQLWERLDDRPAIARALVDLAGLYADLGMLDEARTTAVRALDLAAAAEQDVVRAEARAALGDALAAAADHPGARVHYEEALHELVRLGARDPVIAVRRRLAALAVAAGRADEAVGRALDAARDARDAGLRVEEALLHRIAAAATRMAGDAESAAWFLARAREQHVALALRHGLALCDVEAAEQIADAGRPADAEVLYARAEVTFAELGARGDLERVRARRRDSSRIVRGGVDLAAILTAAGVAIANPAADADAAGTLLGELLAASSFERGFVLAIDDDGRPRILLRRQRSGARGFDRDDGELSGTIVRRVAATGQAVSVGDAALDTALREQRSVIALGLRRIVCAPLRASGRVVGVVYLDATSVVPDGVGADLELRDLEALAPVLALLVERTRVSGEAARMKELMSILAHEIRNPLASILGYAEMCLDPEMSQDVPMPDAVKRIHADAERMGRLVENVLEVTRHERGNLEWSMTAVDVGALVIDLGRSFQLDCDRRGIRLALDIGPSTAMGNRDRLAQVISNLVANAVKFTPRGGTITLVTRREVVRAGDVTAPPAPATELRAWVPAADGDIIGDFIRVEVRDTGPGMSPELLANIFAKFTQGPGATRTRGIGLGLYISREIVRRHGGSIWVESELAKGASFVVRVPVAL